MADLFYGNALLKWYYLNRRDLPWRQTKDPYLIWLSEIILQQTQVAQGINYYLKFVENYPSVRSLAEAPLDDVLKLWQGLGYYSRARNLHATALEISTKYKGVFPASYKELLLLKGIGAYTAAAIASFAFDLPHAVVDGNVYRILSRWFDITTPIDDAKAKAEFQLLADKLLVKKYPADYNQAIMEFGSQYCKPIHPECESCIFNDKCQAYLNKTVPLRPVKNKKIKIKNRYLNYFLIIDTKNQVYVKQRSEKDIWQGLFDLFLIESKMPVKLHQLMENKELQKIIGKKFEFESETHYFKHILTHQHLFAQFFVVRINGQLKGRHKIPFLKLQDLAWPRLIDKFLNSCNLYE